jgi:hypothetical protein
MLTFEYPTLRLGLNQLYYTPKDFFLGYLTIYKPQPKHTKKLTILYNAFMQNNNMCKDEITMIQINLLKNIRFKKVDLTKINV